MKVNLKDRSLLKVSGPDAKTFLQSQLTNDIASLIEDKIQINAYCQHQGKIIAILWVFKTENDFYISVINDLKDVVLSKLNMFKMMSDLKIEDVSSNYLQYGLIDEHLDGSLDIKNNLKLLITKEVLSDHQDISLWDEACVVNMLPEVQLVTTEKFIPQALNLDIDNLGVSFTKGCYPGQEVVARMHYLGKPKRRLYSFKTDTNVKVGDSLNVFNSKSLKSAGIVVRVHRQDKSNYLLASFETSMINEKIHINDNISASVTLVHV